MKNDNIKLPGQRYENAAPAAPVMNKPPIVIPEGIQPQQPKQEAQPKPQNEPKTQSVRNTPVKPPELPLSWLFMPVGSKGRKQTAPIKRLFYALGGFLLWCFSAWLTSVFMSTAIPVFQNSKGLDAAAIASGIGASVFFGVIEFFLWEGEHTMITWMGGLFILGVDVFMNVAGLMSLWHVTKLVWLDGATVVILSFGAGVAFFPEKIMSKAV